MTKHNFAITNEIHKSESTIKSKLELCVMTIFFDSFCSILNVFVLFCFFRLVWGFCFVLGFVFCFGLSFVLRCLMQTKGTRINTH